jgi:hypothetical protein
MLEPMAVYSRMETLFPSLAKERREIELPMLVKLKILRPIAPEILTLPPWIDMLEPTRVY